MPRVSILVFPSVIFVLLLSVSWVRGHEEADEVSPEATDRMERLLNVFTIVKFPNDACNATGGNFYGTCYTATECTALGRTFQQFQQPFLETLTWSLYLFMSFI